MCWTPYETTYISRPPCPYPAMLKLSLKRPLASPASYILLRPSLLLPSVRPLALQCLASRSRLSSMIYLSIRSDQIRSSFLRPWTWDNTTLKRNIGDESGITAEQIQHHASALGQIREYICVVRLWLLFRSLACFIPCRQKSLRSQSFA